MGAPPQIHDETPHVAFCGTGGYGMGSLVVEKSILGGNGF